MEPEKMSSESSLTREDVIAGFRFILGRDPEDERVISAHQAIDTIAALRAVLLKSPEFAEKYQQVVAQNAAKSTRK